MHPTQLFPLSDPFDLISHVSRENFKNNLILFLDERI